MYVMKLANNECLHHPGYVSVYFDGLKMDAEFGKAYCVTATNNNSENKQVRSDKNFFLYMLSRRNFGPRYKKDHITLTLTETP